MQANTIQGIPLYPAAAATGDSGQVATNAVLSPYDQVYKTFYRHFKTNIWSQILPVFFAWKLFDFYLWMFFPSEKLKTHNFIGLFEQAANCPINFRIVLDTYKIHVFYMYLSKSNICLIIKKFKQKHWFSLIINFRDRILY